MIVDSNYNVDDLKTNFANIDKETFEVIVKYVDMQSHTHTDKFNKKLVQLWILNMAYTNNNVQKEEF